jgi:hypothetical protein
MEKMLSAIANLRRRKVHGGRELARPNPQIAAEQPEPELARRQRLHKKRLRKAAEAAEEAPRKASREGQANASFILRARS